MGNWRIAALGMKSLLFGGDDINLLSRKIIALRGMKVKRLEAKI